MFFMPGFLIIDKATGWTSHDVVAKMRGVLGVKKIGHLGTLDPLATGVLVLGVGKEATREIQHFMGLNKSYFVELELGKVSETYDTEGEVKETGFDVDALEESEILAAVESFWGETEQMPPAFSAKKVGGKRAYKLARAGKEVKLSARTVWMQGSKVEILGGVVRFEVEVSSGTYIRSLVHDLGEKLDCGAVMTGLRRLSVGPFMLEEAQTVEEVQDSGARLIPVTDALAML